MNASDQDPVQKRLMELEAEIARLKSAPAAAVSAAPPPLPPIPVPSSPQSTSAVPPPLPNSNGGQKESGPADRFSTLLSLENILSKLGIALLIVGVIYLLKISIDRGWFTPEVRLALGLGLATGLIIGGLRLLGRRAVLGQVFCGGALAIYYACFYSAEQFYHLIKPTPAFLAMLAVTVGGYVLSLYRKVPSPAVIALLGGLASPFLLGNHDLAVVPVGVYTLVLLVGAAAVFWSLGWASVWWSGLLGGAFILHSLTNHFSTSSPGRQIDQVVLSAAFLLWWAMFAVTGLARLIWKGDQSPGLRSGLLVAAFLIPVLGLTGLIETWDLPKAQAGLVVLLAALAYALLSVSLAAHPLHQRAHRLASLLLGVLGLILVLQGDAGFLVVTALSVVLLEAYRRTKETILQVFGHLASAIMAVWLLVRLCEDATRPMMVRPEALADIAAVAALFSVWFRHPAAAWRGVYWIAATVFALCWFGREASVLDNRLAWITLFWGLYALVLIVASVVRWNVWVRRTGLAMLLVVVVKMVLVDLGQLPSEWRVVLFIGFGLLMLAISYLLPRIAPDWNKGAPGEGPSPMKEKETETTPPAAPGNTQEPPPLP
ncbi:MAG: DUF2339 domain-containing protein [Candidatus Methylacidiphilales bacterium]|nr:DUF2339 domain-containing protein [Candidatus Methylacidiphilales bacterium]